MNTGKIKEIGKWLMVTGGTLFTAGGGCYFVANHIEHKEETRVNKMKMDRIGEEHRIRALNLQEEKIKAETEKDMAYAEQLKNMDQATFAKYHAERISVANENVRKEAERAKREAEAEIVKIRLECNEKMNQLREECLRKVEDADRKRDAAVQKYEAIDILFTNKDKILRAKEALEAAVQKDKKTKDNKEELLENIKELLS
jgi:hypothetical protein